VGAVILTAIITHLDAPAVRRQLDYLRALAPGSSFVVCHGGRREDYEQLGLESAVFVEDPSLRGPSAQQSYTAILKGVHDAYVQDDESVELVYFAEYDQLFLRGDFERDLLALAERSAAGLFAKNARPRDDTNWPHLARVRHDPRLNSFIDRISVKNGAGPRWWGCLGSGMLFRRTALSAFCEVEDPPDAYLELFIPTVVHHLGFDVVDVDALGPLYAAVRWRPEYGVEEAIAHKRAGRTFVHPFKQVDALPEVSAA
jgi:hypothetical protein